MIFKSKKKKRPIDVFSKTRKPRLEELYIKFPGKKLKRASKKRGADWVKPDSSLIKKLQNKYGSRYTEIHTHPDMEFLPSRNDIVGFLGDGDVKTSIIVPTKITTGKPRGYFVMKKNRNYKLPELNENLIESVESYYQSRLSDVFGAVPSNFKRLAQKYNFSYRFVPIGGTTLIEEGKSLMSSRQPLETSLVAGSLVLIFLSILINFSNMTGNAISNFSYNTSSTISIGLFVMGLCFAGLMFLFRRKFNVLD